MTQLKRKSDLFSVKVKKEKKGHKSKNKKQDGECVKKSHKSDYLPNTDVQPLTYKTLTVGQVLLGCVSEVRDYELLVSLPHKLVGSISLAHISRPYTALLSKLKDNEEGQEEIYSLQDLYQPGQCVVASVVSIERVNSKTKVSLTLMPNEVNFGISASCLEVGHVLPCAVASLEDKGYAMDTGISSIKGAFLKKEGIGTLGVGSVLRCIITNIFGSDTEDNLRLTLGANPKAVSSATLDLSDTTNVALLLPGTAVNTTISKIHSNALTLMLATLDGVVSSLHLAKPFDRLKQHSLGDSVRARVLYVMPLSKVVHFTLQEGICAKRPVTDPMEGLKIGDIMQEAEIYKCSASGVYIRLSAKTRGFCSANHLCDGNKALRHVARDFRVGKKVTCRLLKYSHMDQLFIVSLQKSVLEQQFIAYSELKPGQVLQATVKGYDDTGARLAVSKLISGHVPSMHLSDGPMKWPELKHTVGDQVTARVLKVNSERQHLLLTLKAQLVEAREPILTEYAQEAENTVTIGYVVKVLPQGLLIGMFSDVKGFVPKSQAGIEPGESLASTFSEGQVVQCRVLRVQPEKRNITLSLLTGDARPSSKAARLVREVEMRARVRCVVDTVKADDILVTLKPHNIRASLPVHHLSDDMNKCRLLRSVLKEGDEIVNAVVFSKAANSRITLTLKLSVCFWVDHGTPEALHGQELVPGESYPAVVVDVKSYGVFVVIPSGSMGNRTLVCIKNIMLPGKWVESKNLGICVGQSLYVTFRERDEKGRPIFTSALRDNLKNTTQSSLQLLYSYLKDEEVVARGFVNCEGQERQLAKFGVGDKVVAVVTKVTPEEVHVTVKNSNVAGVVPSGHQQGKAALEVGQKVKAQVLHVNQEDKCLELTLKPNIIFNLHLNKTEKLEIGMKVKCEVVLAKSNFTMVMMRSTCKGTVAYLPSRMHINVFSGRSLSTTVGRRCWVVVKHVQGPMVLAVLKCYDKGQDLTLASQLPEITFHHQGGEAGSEVEKEETSTKDGEKAKSRCTAQSRQSITEDTAQKKLKSPADDSVSHSTEDTQPTKKKRQLHDQRTAKTKKFRTGKEAILMQAKEGELKQADSGSPTKCGSEETTTCEEQEVQSGVVSAGQKLCLSVGTGFVWDVPDAADTRESSESEDEDVPKRKEKRLRRAECLAATQEEEQRLHRLELSRLQEGQTPHSAMEFEALLQGSPNSSAIWIQFISFHLESAEVDQAKAVARRALQVMDAQEEEERLNVWTVLLRLEVLYGCPESVAEAYREALATNDQLKVHLAMAMVYAENNKLKEAEKVYFSMTKKFSHELSVWVKAGIFYFSNNMAGEGRRCLDRALHSLGKKDHVELINRFGQLEFRFGETERGRTMFESLLSTYWKRIDIWSVYVDLLAKKKDIEGARRVLERLTGLKLKVRKMRFVFKKFLDFEKEHGTPQSVEAVKRRVEEFVATALD